MNSSLRTRERVPGQFGLADVWQLFLDYKYSVLAIAVAATVVAVVIAWLITPTFRAEVVVSEVKDDQLGGGLGGQFGGLASLAGVNLGGFGGDSGEKLGVLRSRALVEEFIKRRQLLPALYPKDVRRQTPWFGVKRFQEKVLGIKEDTRTRLITVSIEWTDPALAARWANEFVGLANEVVRNRDASSAKRNIEFLNRQIQQTSVLELRKVLFNLIESETKTLMLANTREDYAFSVVDPATPPGSKAKPARALIVALGGFFGLAVGMLLAVLRRMRAANAAAG